MHAPTECTSEEYFELFEEDHHGSSNGRVCQTHYGDITAAIIATYHFKLRVLWRLVILTGNGGDPDLRVPRAISVE